MCDGRLARIRAWGEDCHAQPVLWVTPNVALYASLVLHEVAPHQGIVTAMRIVAEELLAQIRLGLWCLCDDQQSCCVFVNAVHQSHLRVVGVVGRQVAQMPGNGMNERAMEIAASGMHHHACRLIDDHQLVVFIAHIKGNILGHDGGVEVGTVEHQGDNIAGTHLIVAFHGAGFPTLLAVVGRRDEQEAGVGSLLYAVAR